MDSFIDKHITCTNLLYPRTYPRVRPAPSKQAVLSDPHGRHYAGGFGTVLAERVGIDLRWVIRELHILVELVEEDHLLAFRAPNHSVGIDVVDMEGIPRLL